MTQNSSYGNIQLINGGKKREKLYKLHVYDIHIAVEILISQIKDKKMNWTFSYPSLYSEG